MKRDRPLTDADREAAVASLRTHAGAGAIDLDAFGDRTAAVLAARTAGDLEAVFADLPGGPPAPAAPLPVASPPPAVRPALAPALAARLAPVAPLAVLFVAIWALTGFGYFWPVWPVMGITIGALKRGRCWSPPRWT